MTQTTQDLLGMIGVWLLVGGGFVIIVELVLMAVWGFGVSRRMRTLAQRIEGERAAIQADMERLRLAIEETKALWRPYRRILRSVRHPLVLAVLGSYRRRMVAR